MKPSERALEFDAVSNSLDYFSRSLAFLRQAPEDPHAWKWVFISLHGALYGFSIIECSGTDYFQVLKTRKKEKLVGNEDLIPFPEAIERLQDSSRQKYLLLNAGQKHSIDMLNVALRNRFIHYIPGSWTIIMDGVPKIILDSTDVIQHISTKMSKSNNITQGDQDRIEHIANEIRKLISDQYGK